MRFSPHAELVELRRFLVRPRPIRQGDPVASDWAVRASFFAGLLLAVNVPLDGLLLDPLGAWAGLASRLPESPSWRFFVLAAVVAPLSEEVLFRAGLRLPAYTLFVGPVLLILVFGAPGASTLLAAGGVAVVAITVALGLHLLVGRHAGGSFALERRFVAHYAWVFWGYCALFAFAHIGNYVWDGPRSALVVVTVAPQFVAGVVTGYLRLRDGLRSSLLVHLLNNLAGFALIAATA